MLKIAMNTYTTIKGTFESTRNNKGLPSFKTKYMIEFTSIKYVKPIRVAFSIMKLL